MDIVSSHLDTQARALDCQRPVYVVDDDSMVRRALFLALRTAGFQPRSFSSGRDFLDEVETLASGCVLLDLRLPEMDGIAILREMGAQTQRLPVVMITGHGEVEVAVRAMKQGASDFLEKPLKDDELLNLLEELFGGLTVQAELAAQRQLAMQSLKELTPRERQILQGLIDGLTNKLVAQRLDISARTVEVHRANMMKKLETGSVSEATRLALLAGMKPSGSVAQRRKRSDKSVTISSI
jgi:two-component system response regulator FixJ